MIKLENSLLSDIYEKCVRHFVNGIDPEIHANAYVGEHAPGFAESEFAGKYIDICIQFYKYTNDKALLENAEKVVNSIISNQRNDGYIGGYRKGEEWERFSVWNQAFTIYGLLSYHDITNDTAAFEAAEKCAFYIIEHYLNTDAKILDAPNNGSQHLVMLVPVSKLYAITKKDIYKSFIEYVFEEMRNSDNNFLEFESILDLRSKKAIENFCCLIGMLMYGELTDNESIIKACKKYWSELSDTQITETGNGSVSEVWIKNGNAPTFRDANIKPNENCVAVGWAELSMLLFRLEKKSKYLDEIEKTLFNHLIGSLDKDCTDFAYYQPNFGKRITRTAESAYKCCRYRGYSAVSFIPENLFLEDNAGIIPLIYTNAVFENSKIKIKEETNYPFDSKIKFTLNGSSAIKLRIPAWCKNHSVTLNGETVYPIFENGFVIIDKIWNNDELIIELNTELEFKHAIIDGKKYVGINYGYVVCVLNCINEGDILATSIDVTHGFERLYDTEYNLAFKATGYINGKKTDIQIVDYAYAGKLTNTDEYTIWISEE